MLRFSAVLGLCLSLANCGAIYKSSSIDDQADHIEVRTLTNAQISRANASPYTPRVLPHAFFATVRPGVVPASTGVSPIPALTRPVRPSGLSLLLPPQVTSSRYTLGVGDVVLLSTKRVSSGSLALDRSLTAPSARQGFTIVDDGSITLPEVGRIELAGKTLDAANDAIFQKMVSEELDPSISLEVLEYNSQRVAVGGSVVRPTVVPVGLTLPTIEEAIVAAGGVASQDPESTALRLYRDGTLYQIPLTDFRGRADIRKLRLKGGDSIHVDTAYELDRARGYFQEQIALADFNQRSQSQALSQLNTQFSMRQAALNNERQSFQARIALGAVKQDYVYLTGEVAKTGRTALPFGHRAVLADVLFGENGFRGDTGDPTEIYVLRAKSPDSDQVIAWNLDLTDASNTILATRFELRPSDVIFVAEQPVTKWNRTVQQIVPSLITTGLSAATR